MSTQFCQIVYVIPNAFTDEPGERRGRLMLRAWLDLPQSYPISRGLRLYYDDLRSAYTENLPSF